MFTPKLEVLPPAQRDLWPKLADLPDHFVLYGGTAVALRCGHRISEDFDFFSAQPFLAEDLVAELPWLSSPQVLQRSENTFTLQVGREQPIKLSFFGDLQFGQVGLPEVAAGNRVKVASAVDLLALKLGVIQQRVEAKDYWDIHALLAAGLTLEQGLSALEALHPLTTNWMIALKTLVYFQGGDLESLSAAIRRDLEKAVSQVREVPAFAGAKLPIGSGIC